MPYYYIPFMLHSKQICLQFAFFAYVLAFFIWFSSFFAYNLLKTSRMLHESPHIFLCLQYSEIELILEKFPASSRELFHRNYVIIYLGHKLNLFLSPEEVFPKFICIVIIRIIPAITAGDITSVVSGTIAFIISRAVI